MAQNITVRIIDQKIDPDKLAEEFRVGASSSGAIVTFLGQVRSENNAVQILTLEHYPGFTDRAVVNIAKEAIIRWPINYLTIVHRVGDMQPEDPIVFVAVAAAHRRPAFEATDFLMDYLKSEAPFWKKETSNGGEYWVEPTKRDYDDKQRWR